MPTCSICALSTSHWRESSLFMMFSPHFSPRLSPWNLPPSRPTWDKVNLNSNDRSRVPSTAAPVMFVQKNPGGRSIASRFFALGEFTHVQAVRVFLGYHDFTIVQLEQKVIAVVERPVQAVALALRFDSDTIAFRGNTDYREPLPFGKITMVVIIEFEKLFLGVETRDWR